MLTKPRFKSTFDVRTVGDNVLVLIDEHRQLALEGKIFVHLAPLLNGENGIAEISARLATTVPIPRVFAALNILEKRGLIAEAGEVSELDRFAEYFDEDMLRQGPAIKEGVSLRGVAGLETAGLATALEANGLSLSDEGGLQVVLTDDYLREELGEINEAALKSGRPWLLAKPVGSVLWIGPFFQPGETGCWTCLEHRLSRNRQVEGYLLLKRGGERPIVSRSRHPGSMEVANGLIATEVAKWLRVPGASNLIGSMVTLDLGKRSREEHTLVRRPQCATCGDPLAHQLNREGPLELTSCKKEFTSDGGHRSTTPEKTYERFKHHISPFLGAVSELTAVPWGVASDLTNTCVAGHNFSLGVENLSLLKESLRSMSGGKGASKVQSMASGLCEAIERYSGLFHGDEFTLQASYEELGDKAIHPNEYMGFSPAQFESRKMWKGPVSKSLLIATDFDESQTIDWTPAWSLTKGNNRYVPTALCYYGHKDFREGWSLPCSNGCAAGNTREEAILQGVMELIERDSVGLWWYNKIRRRGVDLESFESTYLTSLLEFYKTIKRDLVVIDITSDNGITTLAAVSRRTDSEVEDIVVGFGAHFDPRIAALRACTEVNQFLPWLPGALLPGSSRYLYPDALAREWWKTARLASETYLVPLEDEPLMRLEDFTNPSTNDLKEDVLTAVEIGKTHGFELLLVDQTRVDLGLHVARVIAPELCHFWRRFGKKRLFETPVKMGWLDKARSEEELNRFTIFF